MGEKMESQTPVPPQPSVSHSRSCSAITIVNLVLRAMAFVLLFIALIVLTTASHNVYIDDYDSTAKFHFNDFYAYRYTLYTIVVGMVYALLQTALAIFHLASGKLLSPVLIQVDFYADKLISYTLATGAAAAFGITVDAIRHADAFSFWNKTSASASLLLFGFICSAVSSIFSSLALSKNK